MSILRPNQPVAVEFTDNTGKRVRRVFTDAYQARCFYALQDKAGRNPKVCRVLDK